ncbi:MAG: DNA polymerase IV [Candidatus Staskawiczbacteria bacterium]|nr:DNA polymerase IV [Candidatus Staskawiczbacteria bacterium]
MRIIGHLDMDAFFASIEERNNPRFKGMPIVVGADPKEGYGRGVVSTANYKAREYGIHSAMPISRAWRLSQEAEMAGKPEAIFLPPDFESYEKSSKEIFFIIKKYADLAEQASIDEFYFDLSSLKSFKKAKDVSKKIKEEIRKKEKVTCSVGIGRNKLISKIAAGIKKPDGLFIVRQGEEESFLEPMPIRILPGIGPKTEALLNLQNIRVIKDLKQLSMEKLDEMLGKWGVDLYYKARGEDNSPIVENREIKSIGEQNTFERNNFDILFISSELEKYCARVFERFKKSDFSKFKTISLTVRFSDFKTITSSKSFKIALGLEDLKKFQFESLKLLLPFFDRQKNPKLKLFRLIGIRIENLQK